MTQEKTTAHLTLPYNWENCVNPETCDRQIHLPDTADTLNSYPQEWTRALLPAECLDAEGTITLYNSGGKIHSSYGAAKERNNGTLEWRTNGKLHRQDKPAVIHPDKSEEWWLNGRPHRESGPAIIYADGTQEWWFNGTQYPNPPYA